VDGHQGRQSALLNQRHADGCGNSDTLKGGRLLGRKLSQIVVKDQRSTRAKILHRKLSEIGEAVVADDARRSGRAPVAPDREPVLIGVHIRICAYRDLEIFAGHLRRDRHDRVGVVAFRGLLTESVQEEEPCFVLLHLALGRDPQRGFNYHGNYTRRFPALSEHRRVVEVHEDLLGCPGAMQRQFLIAVRQGIAGHADLHDVVVEVRDLGPSLANLASSRCGCRPPAKTE
jgi:hypothetical protein